MATGETLQTLINSVWVAIALDITHKLLLLPLLWVTTVVEVWPRPEKETMLRNLLRARMHFIPHLPTESLRALIRKKVNSAASDRPNKREEDLRRLY